jgi:PAS domain S-box-containing protein
MSTTELNCLDFVATAVFVLDVDSDGQPVYSAFNAFAQSHSGLSVENVIGKTAKEVFPGRGGENAHARHLDVIRTGDPQEYEIRLEFNSKIRLIRTIINPHTDTYGNVIRLFGTSKDITQEEMGREVQATVKTITNEMEDFITMAAHDLRTPMRNVHHIADMLRDDFEDLGDGKLDLIDLLEDVAIKATSLISDVLAHAQATKASEQVVTFDFAELCSELGNILDPLEIHNLKSSDGLIVGDKTAYQIVIRNLLDNAFKHGGRDKLELSISLLAHSETMMEVIVSDNGKGFENPGIAFLESGKMRTDSGFGLLGIRRLVQSRGGTISAEKPKAGRGSRIRFTLPGKLIMHTGMIDQQLAASVS